jgi:M6 family metalloprotease-like protein
VPGRDDPHAAGLLPDANITHEMYLGKRSGILSQPDDAYTRISAGTMNNLAIFIRFAGEDEISEPFSFFDSMFNAQAAHENSLYNYFRETSYGSVSIHTFVFPEPSGDAVLSYQDQKSRSYFQPYDAMSNTGGYRNDYERRDREHGLLERAVISCRDQIPAALNIDMDNDGRVDNIVFILSGDSGEWGGLLWPHKWALDSRSVRVGDKRVYTYNLQLVNFLKAKGTGVLCHEMFHTLGAPDLYHHNVDGLKPVGAWDIMSTTQDPPQHMGAYMKYRYGGWITGIPTISAPGTYTLHPQTVGTQNAYRLDSPNSSTEYFVVEYRRQEGVFEATLESEGLLLYRINTTRDGKGNRDGPPDEIYVYRPGGTVISNGNPADATLNRAYGRISICDTTSPSPFLSNGSPGGIFISNVTDAGHTISFDVDFAAAAPKVTTEAATNVMGLTARLRGEVYPAGTPRTWFFEYGVSPELGHTTAMSSTADETTWIPVHADIDGLQPTTTYYYRCVISGPQGLVYGSVRFFSTRGGPPQISVSPESTDFGTVRIGGSRERDITVANSGLQLLAIEDVTLAGVHASMFCILDSSAASLAPGASTTMRVQYAPVVPGTHTASVRFRSNDTSQPIIEVEIHGTGDAEKIVPLIHVVGSVHLCPAKSVTLIAEDGFVSYEWSTGEKSRIIIVSDSGVFGVTVTDDEGRKGTSESIEVYAHPVPFVTVDRIGDVLVASESRTYQWYKDDFVLQGETNRSLTLTRAGSYRVEISDENGCESRSDAYVIHVLRIDDGVPAEVAIDVYPQPASSTVHVKISSATPVTARVQLLDALGRILHDADVSVAPPGTQAMIDVRGIRAGCYFLRSIYGRSQVVRPLLIRRATR